MSGITGLLHRDGRSASTQDLERMVQSLAHRGPDGAAVWTDGGVGLGHCLTCTTPESLRECQPLVSRDQGLALVGDARIDNRKELIDKLGWQKRPAGEISDSALILGAYARWGEECPERLLGDFAFALWDERRQSLFCARDHLGLRPFYYFINGGIFVFASEIKALLTLPRAPRRLNETRVADYLMNLMEDKEATFYEGILRLPPAHTLTVTVEELRRRQYWALDPEREIRYSSDGEYAEAYREIFTEAIRCRVRSAFPVGSWLSGGLDSSSVTCVARELLADSLRPLDTFSLVFDDVPQCDERPYIEAVLEQGGLRSHQIHGDRLDQFADLDQMLWHEDEPFFTPNLFLYWNLYRQARDQGVRVALDGFLGDNVVSHGSRYLTELAATGRWVKLAREIYTTAGVFGNRRKRSVSLLKSCVLAPLVKEPLQRWRDGLRRPELPPGAFSQFINRDLTRRVEWMQRARDFKVEAVRTPLRSKEEHFADLTSGAMTGVLETINKSAAAFGVTPRLPFSDRRLMEYCLATPVTQKYEKGWTRVIARRGIGDYLPEKVRLRYGKTYLQGIFQRSLFLLGQAEMSSLVSDRLSIAADYVNVAALRQTYGQILERQKQGQHQRYGEESLALWYAVMLTRWLEGEKGRLAGPVNPAWEKPGIVAMAAGGSPTKRL